MLFRFLRQYFRDEDFEQNQFELVQTKEILTEYRQFIQEQREQVKEEKETIDPDFLSLIWASIGFAFLVFGESAQKIIELQNNRTFPFYIWSIFSFFSLVFIIFNSIFALEITRKYAKSKSNSGYVTYAYFVIVGAALLVLGVFGFAFLK